MDLFLLSFFKKQIFFLLLSMYIFQLYSHTPSLTALTITALLIGLESFVVHGHFGIQFIYLLPATLIALYAQQSFYAPRVHPYLLLLLCMGAHALLLDRVTPLTAPAFLYTKSQIVVNLVVLWCIIRSLNKKYW
jgi:hypothetical protein